MASDLPRSNLFLFFQAYKLPILIIRAIKKYSILDKAELDRGAGGIVCMCEDPIPIDEKKLLYLKQPNLSKNEESFASWRKPLIFV